MVAGPNFTASERDSPNLQNVCGLVENCAIHRGVRRRGGDDVKDAGRAHHSHWVPGPAVEVAKLVIGDSGVSQPTVHPCHVVLALLYLHRVLAVVEAPAEAGGCGEGVDGTLDNDRRANICSKRLLLISDTPRSIWNVIKWKINTQQRMEAKPGRARQHRVTWKWMNWEINASLATGLQQFLFSLLEDIFQDNDPRKNWNPLVV